MRQKNTTDFSSAISKALCNEYENRKDRDTHYNQRRFAHDLKIDYSLLSHYMVGDRTPSLENLDKIRSSLNCSFDCLLDIKPSKDANPSEEERLIDEIALYTGLSARTIKQLHTYIGDEFIEIIELLLDSDEYTFSLLNSLYDYFTFSPQHGAYLTPSLDAYEMEGKIVINAAMEDFYDGLDGRMFISGERYAQLKEENIMDIIASIKLHSSFHLVQLEERLKDLKKDIKKASSNNSSASLIDSLKMEAITIKNEISKIKAFQKRRDNNGKD